MIDFVSSNNLINLQNLQREHWKVELPFFAKLTGIDIQILENYSPIHSRSTPAKVTDLATYQ